MAPAKTRLGSLFLPPSLLCLFCPPRSCFCLHPKPCATETTLAKVTEAPLCQLQGQPSVLLSAVLLLCRWPPLLESLSLLGIWAPCSSGLIPTSLPTFPFSLLTPLPRPGAQSSALFSIYFHGFESKMFAGDLPHWDLRWAPVQSLQILTLISVWIFHQHFDLNKAQTVHSILSPLPSSTPL